MGVNQMLDQRPTRKFQRSMRLPEGDVRRQRLWPVEIGRLEGVLLRCRQRG